MLNFITSILGLIAAIIMLIAASIGLIVILLDRIPGRVKKKLGAKASSGAVAILFIVGLGVLLFNVTYKPPTVAILFPSGSIEPTTLADSNSVWFSVSGTSSRVVSNNALMIYVLVHSGTEWHVQRPAPVDLDGRWTLEKAWIGDDSAPISSGDRIRLIAVVSRGKYNPDDKFADYRQLSPVAVSAIVSAKVATVRGR